MTLLPLRRLVAVGVAVIGSAMAAHAADISVTVLQYGLFTTEELEPSTGTDGTTMRASVVTNVCHVMTTSIVPAGGGPGIRRELSRRGLAARDAGLHHPRAPVPRPARPRLLGVLRDQPAARADADRW